MIQSQYDAHQDGESRRLAADLRIKEKIAVLEKWKEDGVPENYQWHMKNKEFGCPINLSEFQQWNDPELKIEVCLDGKKYSVQGVFSFSAMTLDKPSRFDLKESVETLLRNMKNRPAPKKKLVKLKAEKKSLESFTQQLLNENVKLNNKIEELNQYLEEAKSVTLSLENRVKKQDEELKKIRPFRPRLLT